MKRADLCIIAMKHVRKKYKTAKLYIVGNGPEEKSLDKFIKRHRLTKNVFIIKKNNFYLKKNIKDLKVKLMRKAWAIVLPSVKEGWGMVVTEAAACGTPAIVSNVTGLVDSVVEDKTGFIVSSDPSEFELAESMIRMIEDKKTRVLLSEQAKKRSLDFTWEKSYTSFKKLLFTS